MIEGYFPVSSVVNVGALIPGFSLIYFNISRPKSFIESFIESLC